MVLRRALVVLSLACVLPSCGFTQVRQSSLVPVPAMPPPVANRKRADLYVGDSLVSYLGTRELRPNAEAGLWIPRHQLDGSFTVRTSRYFSVRAMGGVGLAEEASAASPTLLPNPGLPVPWGGVGIIGNFLHPSGFGVDAELDTMFAAVPSLMQYRTCYELGGCSNWTPFYRETDWVPMIAGTVRFSYAFSEWFTLYGGFTVRNHPTNDAAFTDGPWRPESSVEMGDPTFVLGLGAELTVADSVSIIPQASWPVFGGPVAYGPTFGLALRGRFLDGPGDEAPPWRRREEAPVRAPAPSPAPEPVPQAEEEKFTPEPTDVMAGGPIWMR